MISLTCFLRRSLPGREAGGATSGPLPHPAGLVTVQPELCRAAVPSGCGQGALCPGLLSPVGAQRQSGAELPAAPVAPGAQLAAGCDWLTGEAAASYWAIRKFRKARAAAATRSAARAGSALAGDPGSTHPRTAHPPKASTPP